jgi:hypothetical protein
MPHAQKDPARVTFAGTLRSRRAVLCGRTDTRDVFTAELIGVVDEIGSRARPR